MTNRPSLSDAPQFLQKHIPELDGLRGMAVLAVMIFHFFLFGDIEARSRIGKALTAILNIGWSGVDLFFVLSGFLITGILYDSRLKPGFFRTFYLRRVLRIVPLYYLFLALTFLVLPSIRGFGAFLPVAPSDQFWLWAHLSNVRIALVGWGAVTPTLRHFWSLAIEEQFYLLWPWVVFAVSRRRLLHVCTCMYFGATILRIGLCANGQWLAGYVLTPTRMDALAVGAFLALLMREPLGYKTAVRCAKPVLAGSVLLLAVLFVVRKGLKSHDPLVVALGSSLLSLAFGAVLILGLSCPPNAHIRRLLAAPPFQWFGKYSYALYVFHQPLAFYLGAVRTDVATPSWLRVALSNSAVYFFVAFGLSVAAAFISWHCCEKHFLKLKDRFAQKSKNSKEPGESTACAATACILGKMERG